MAKHLQSKIFPIQTNRHYRSWFSEQPLVPNFLPCAYIIDNSKRFISCTKNISHQEKLYKSSTQKYHTVVASLWTKDTNIPLWTEQNKNGFVPSLENRQRSIFSSCNMSQKSEARLRRYLIHRTYGWRKHTEFLVKVVTGVPSLVFHIVAEPSAEVVAKNSESKLRKSNTTNQKLN